MCVCLCVCVCEVMVLLSCLVHHGMHVNRRFLTSAQTVVMGRVALRCRDSGDAIALLGPHGFPFSRQPTCQSGGVRQRRVSHRHTQLGAGLRFSTSDFYLRPATTPLWSNLRPVELCCFWKCHQNSCSSTRKKLPGRLQLLPLPKRTHSFQKQQKCATSQLIGKNDQKSAGRSSRNAAKVCSAFCVRS